MADRSQLVERFVQITHSSEYLAEQYLDRNDNDLTNAVEDFFANSASTNSVSKPSTSSKSSKSGVRTFRDLNDEDEDEDDKTQTNFFTGGEKSGLQVEDPNKDKKKSGRSLIDDIFQRAKDQMNEPDDRPSALEDDIPKPKFTGDGHKLGDGEGPSQTIPDPTAHFPRKPEKANREIIFWKQGFTVADGPLHRYDDPNNAAVLQELNQGRVPLALLDVEFGQDVDVSVVRKTDEDYRPPKKKAGGYGGSGHRLGSPVPGEPIVPQDSNPQPSISNEAPTTKKPEPESHGDAPVQIRFANGKRTSYKFNSSDPISVVYDYVKSHEFSDPSRSFILSHAFPVKPIENSTEQTVGDAKLKNSVIVQRWS